MSKLSEALAAMDKATPGPWEVFFTGTIGKYVVEISEKSVHKRIATTTQPNATLIAAAPALVRRVQELEDWQAKALPWLRGYKKFVSGERIEALSALIAQAEGSR